MDDLMTPHVSQAAKRTLSACLFMLLLWGAVPGLASAEGDGAAITPAAVPGFVAPQAGEHPRLLFRRAHSGQAGCPAVVLTTCGSVRRKKNTPPGPIELDPRIRVVSKPPRGAAREHWARRVRIATLAADGMHPAIRYEGDALLVGNQRYTSGNDRVVFAGEGEPGLGPDPVDAAAEKAPAISAYEQSLFIPPEEIKAPDAKPIFHLTFDQATVEGRTVRDVIGNGADGELREAEKVTLVPGVHGEAISLSYSLLHVEPCTSLDVGDKSLTIYDVPLTRGNIRHLYHQGHRE
jgi:hypothetical protein